MKGTVKMFNQSWGFIKGDDTKEVFVHQTSIIMNGFRILEEGQRVEYEIEELDGKTKAINVQVLAG